MLWRATWRFRELNALLASTKIAASVSGDSNICDSSFCSWLVHCDSRSERFNRRLALCKPGLREQSQEACCFAHAFHAIPVRSVDKGLGPVRANLFFSKFLQPRTASRSCACVMRIYKRAALKWRLALFLVL